jgi:hypothetical protein
MMWEAILHGLTLGTDFIHIGGTCYFHPIIKHKALIMVRQADLLFVARGYGSAMYSTGGGK